MKDTITLPRAVLFELAASHSRLAQAEYERNPSYNDSNFSAVAEHLLINSLKPDDLERMLTFITDYEVRNFSRQP